MKKTIFILSLVLLVLLSCSVFASFNITEEYVTEVWETQYLMFNAYYNWTGLFDDIYPGISDHGENVYYALKETSQKTFSTNGLVCLKMNDTYIFESVTTNIYGGTYAAKNISYFVINSTFDQFANDAIVAYCGSYNGPGNDCSKGLIEDHMSQWLSSNNGDANITLDFGSNKSIRAISWNNYFGTRYNYNWSYYCSTDNSSWVNIGNFSQSPTDNYLSHYDDVVGDNCRYLRWEIWGGSDGYRGGNIRVYDTNLSSLIYGKIDLGYTYNSTKPNNMTLDFSDVEGNTFCFNITDGFANRYSIGEMIITASLLPVNSIPVIQTTLTNFSVDYTDWDNFSVSVNVTDADADNLTCYIYVNGTLNETLQQDENTIFVLNGNITQHVVDIPYYVNCTDGTDSVQSDTFYIDYTNSVCSNSVNPTSFSFDYTDLTWTLSDLVTDLDGDAMSVYFYWNGALNQTNTSIATGTNITIDKTLSLHTDYNFSWACEDAYQASNTSTSTYTITYGNTAPVFDPALTNQNMLDNETFTYDTNCTDADSDTITYYLNTTADGLSINSTSGLITDATPESMSIQVLCGDGYTNTSGTFTLSVVSATAASGGSGNLGIGIILIGILFAYLLLGLKLDDEHQALKLGFIIYTFVLIVACLYIAWQLFNFNYTQAYDQYEIVSNALRMLFIVNVPLMIFVFSYFIFYYIYKVFKSIGKKHKE